MSGAADRMRTHKRDEDQGNAGAAAGWDQLSTAERATYTAAVAAAAAAPTAPTDASNSAVAVGTVTVAAAAAASLSSSHTDSAAGLNESAGGVQPLAEQMRQRLRFRSPLDLLAEVELQLAMQFLDMKSKLKVAQSSRRLLQAVSHSFAWKDVPIVVRASTPADVKRIVPSLLRYAPVHLRCIRMASLECVAAVPQLHGLQLHQIPRAAAASLTQQLQHPCAAQLLRLRLDQPSSRALLSIDTMALIAGLPQLRTLELLLPRQPEASVALLQPLAAAPALTDLSLGWSVFGIAGTALLDSIASIVGMRRLRLDGVAQWKGDAFRTFFTSPTIRRLQHLQLIKLYATPGEFSSFQAPSAAEYEAAFSAMQQLQSLSLEWVLGIDALLSHLRHAVALRLVAIRCRLDAFGHDYGFPVLPSRSTLAELLAAAPQLEVRLLLPPSLESWLAMESSASAAIRSVYAEQWNQLHRMAEELERVGILYDESM